MDALPDLSGKRTRSHTKLPLLSERIRELAYQRGPGARLPTILELCDTFGTSKVTLSTVLNQLEASNVLYRKSGNGGGIFVSPTLYRKHLALVLGSSYFHQPGGSPFWDMLWSLLVSEANQRQDTRNEEFSFHVTRRAEDGEDILQEHLIRPIKSGHVHGILSIGLDYRTTRWLTERGIPQVAFATGGKRSVAIDSNALARLAVRELVGQECRKIGYWVPASPQNPSHRGAATDAENTYSRELQANFERMLVECGLTICPEWIRVHLDPPGTPAGAPHTSHQEQGYRTALALFGRPKATWPDALVSGDDMMTLGILAAFRKLAIPLGDQVKIASHSNAGSSVLFGYEDELILIEVDPMDIVTEMFRMLDTLMAEEVPEELTYWVRPRRRLVR